MQSESLNSIGPLTEAQWQGLARLGDLGNRLGELVEGPLAGPTTAALDRLGEISMRYDLEALAAEVLDLLEVFQRAGLLQLARDNAEFVGKSLELLAPLLAQWIEQASKMPFEETKADIAVLAAGMHRLRQDASALASRGNGQYGGFGGLWHLLLDRRVQRGLRVLSALALDLGEQGERSAHSPG
jgi:hypothetical protein